MLALCKNEIRFFSHRLFEKGSKVSTQVIKSEFTTFGYGKA